MAGVVVVPFMGLSRVVIVHGYSATPADHWFGSLARSLENEGIAVRVPALPNSESPDLERWITAVGRAVGIPDERTGIVTHSLGGVTTLHALDRVPGDWRLGALVAVAGFVSPLPVLPELDPFTAVRPDVERTAACTGARTVLLSDNDAYVPAAHTLALGESLQAETISIPGAGHFLAEDGVTTLPSVAERLLNL
ncbi:MAG: alpha/beta hydrolase [Actinomycetota bacterium]|nr:alpha/beta hydrolase [Actinomycetota bacterium]